MGDNTRKRRGGLKSQGMDVTFHQKFTCVDATLFGIVGCQSCIEVRACNACSTDSNPRYQGTWHLPRYSPMSGAVGSLLDATVTFEPAGDPEPDRRSDIVHDKGGSGMTNGVEFTLDKPRRIKFTLAELEGAGAATRQADGRHRGGHDTFVRHHDATGPLRGFASDG